MTIITLAEAEQEFIESIDYYEAREPGLGLGFVVRSQKPSIGSLSTPRISRLRKKGYRRVNLHVLPHYVAYVIRQDTIRVVAIAHGHRRPEFWIGRSIGLFTLMIAQGARSAPHLNRFA